MPALQFDPPPAQPLNYAGPAVPGRAEERTRGVVFLLGGARRLSFALGLALVLGGFGYGMWPVWGSA